jgi:phosphoribosylanthranilate isomerase
MSHIRIKICGITRVEDALTAAQLGVDAVGLIFAGKSPRYISPENAAKIVAQLPPFVSRVGVFVDERVESIIAISHEVALDTIQLHGSEAPSLCREIPYPVIKALGLRPDFTMAELESYPVAGILLDTWGYGVQGGTGIAGDWNLARKIAERYDKIILAGGLGPSNLEAALSAVRPYGVDINSGVEIKPGVKNPQKMREAVRIIRGWQPVL